MGTHLIPLSSLPLSAHFRVGGGNQRQKIRGTVVLEIMVLSNHLLGSSISDCCDVHRCVPHCFEGHNKE